MEYFTKWVEVVTLRIVEGKHIVAFIHMNILCRFPVPHDIVLDNGTHFKNEHMQNFCSKFRIKRQFSAPYYLQGNGQVEARTMKRWHEKEWLSPAKNGMKRSTMHYGHI
uniref:Integrase catalytic domain-containing protein n=1 Tax=Nymphaea colorata TaxID=210225 RepID=A0A5K1EC56_9MAGN